MKVQISWKYADTDSGKLTNSQYLKWVTRLGYKHSYDDGDLLLLIGGADLGQQPDRDRHENNLITKYLEQGKPIFGICRGMQMLAVRYGYDLIQHIPDVTSSINHLSGIGNYKGNSSWHKIMDDMGNSYIVNSRHHQGFLRQTDMNMFCKEFCWSEDGIVEGIRGRDFNSNFSALQSHPEREEVWDTDTEYIAKQEISRILHMYTYGV